MVKTKGKREAQAPVQEEASTRRSKRTKGAASEQAVEEEGGAPPARGSGRKQGSAQPLAKKEQAEEPAADREQEEGADSDDEAPEEVSLSVAKSSAAATRRAEAENAFKLKEGRRKQNRAKEALLAKNKQEALAADILKAVAKEEGSRKMQQEELEDQEEVSRRGKVIQLEKKKDVVKKQGFTLEKLSSRSLVHSASARQSTSSQALHLLSAHFGNVRRQDYTSVHDRSRRPSPLFSPELVAAGKRR